MLAILKAASGDGRFLGLDIPLMHSWLFSEQSAHSLAPQLELLNIKGDANITPFLWREQPTFDSNDQFAQTLYDDFMAAAVRPQIVVIDTLATFIGIEDSNDYSAVKRAMTPIIQVGQSLGAMHGTATMFVHHDRKSGGAGSDSILGSRIFAALVDTLLHLSLTQTAKRRALRVQSRFGLGEIGEVVEVELKLPEGEYQIASAGEDFDDLIVDAVAQGALTRGDIQRAVKDAGENDLSDSVAVKRIKTLVADKRIIRTGRGKATAYSMPEGSGDASND